MRKNWIRIAVIVSIILISLITSYFIDLFVLQILPQKSNHLNIDDIQTTYTNLIINEDGSFTTTSDNATIEYTFPPSYLYKMVFDTQTDGRKLIYVVEIDGVQKYPNNIFEDSFSIERETVNIDSECSTITVKILELTPDITFRFNLVDLDYSVRSNPVVISCIFLFILMIFFSLALWLKFIKFKFENLALIYTLTFGLLLAFLVPPSYSYDEYAHLVKALKTSNFILYTPIEETTYLPEKFEFLDRADYRSYEDYIDEESRLGETQLDTYVNTLVRSYNTSAYGYTFLPYILSAIGLKIAATFKINLFYWTFMARIGNVLFYAFSLYFTLKIFPGNKPFLFFVAMLPMMIHSGVTVGTSSMMLGCIFLALGYLAYCIKVKEEIYWKDYIFLITLFFLITNCRMPNGLLALILLLLPQDKIRSESLKKTNRILTVILTFVFMLFIYLYNDSVGLTIIDIPGVNPHEQIRYILYHIPEFLEVLFNFTFRDLLKNGLFIDYDFTYNIGYILPIVTFFMVIMFMFLALAGNPDRLAYDTPLAQIIMWGVFIIIVGLTATAEYVTFTPVGANTILGFQPRYILTILFIPFLTLESKNFYLETNPRILNNVTNSFIVLVFICYISRILAKFYM